VGLTLTDYIKNMRKLIGNKPILQCGASVILINKNGEILLQLRADNNYWSYPGGSVELDEKVEDAAKRELFEETGLIANTLELYGVFSGSDFHYIYPNGDEVSNIDVVFICKNYSGVLKADLNEAHDLKFFSLNNIPMDISPPVIKIINKFISENLH
jgi:8-oxo-dGTP pyrophosphatase MutT (NUDIX family)